MLFSAHRCNRSSVVVFLNDDLQGIDDLCLKYFVEAGAMAVRRVTKDDLSNIARATGGMCSVLCWACPYLMARSHHCADAQQP